MPKHIASLTLISLLCAFHAFAQEPLSEAKKADITRLLEVTGALQIGNQMSQLFAQQMTEAIKKTHPDVPPEIFDVLREEANATIAESMFAKGGFVDMILPIYHKHFSHEEIKGLIAFYQTSLEKKTISVLPTILQESMQAGRAWGQSLGPELEKRVRQRFKAKGITLP